MYVEHMAQGWQGASAEAHSPWKRRGLAGRCVQLGPLSPFTGTAISCVSLLPAILLFPETHGNTRSRSQGAHLETSPFVPGC